jgi:hypothetical protein
MKTNKTMVAMLMGITLFSFVATTQAQYTATGADGITASPKARELIDRQTGVSTAPAAPAKAMACAQCKDEYVTRTDLTARGVNKPTVTAVRHLCGGCETSWVVTGSGKTQKSTAVHSCTAGETSGASCCAAKTAS